MGTAERERVGRRREGEKERGKGRGGRERERERLYSREEKAIRKLFWMLNPHGYFFTFCFSNSNRSFHAHILIAVDIVLFCLPLNFVKVAIMSWKIIYIRMSWEPEKHAG